MDIKQSLDYKFLGYQKSTNLGRKKYDYARDGILIRVLPPILFRGNPTLVAFLQLIEIQLITMFKHVEAIRKFKHISSY